MTCPACGVENREGSRFCNDCGKPLLAPARSPGPRNYTPRHLAEKILTTRAALEGERKQVTVFFADVKGSMDLAEQVDAEVFHHVMERFAALLAEGVHRFEGTVTQFTGDGIMALFGAPIAHEDHAQRACYTALHLRDEVRRFADELRRGHGLSFAVCSVRNTLPDSASCSIRAANPTVCPCAVYSMCRSSPILPTTTSPELRPIRTEKLRPWPSRSSSA